jgi:hypothetical protein
MNQIRIPTNPNGYRTLMRRVLKVKLDRHYWHFIYSFAQNIYQCQSLRRMVEWIAQP